MNKNKKTAVILFNLGGPSDLNAVKPFLFNLFYDPAIIPLPNPFRYFLAKFISWKRENTAKEIYSHIGGKSPILEETNAQAQALEAELKEHGRYKVFVCMRYWHPLSSETAKAVKEYAPDEILLLPLYPQLSTSTSTSSINDWEKAIANEYNGAPPKSKTLCCYPNNDGFVSAYSQLLTEELQKTDMQQPPTVLFSAHGLPVRNIEKGDPYQHQVEVSVAKIVDNLHQQGLTNFEHIICYQSKVGNLKWLEPSTEDVIKELSAKSKAIIIVPIAFVSEHSETLVELDIEYKEIAQELGCPNYVRIPAVSTHTNFITGLKNMCLSEKNNFKCPNNFKGCYCFKN